MSQPIERGPVLLVGLGVTNRAVATALVRRGVEVLATDDRPTEVARTAAGHLGIDLVEAPGPDRLDALVAGAAAVVPSPGVPDHHPVFAAAADAGVPVRSEFDLAAAYDDRPRLAVTGTDGKTTVVALVTAMLEASGVRAAAVGNTELPLVAAIDDPEIAVFVVEASSFRLAHTAVFRPEVATWLNFAADHQDAHSSLSAYESAKARIWTDQEPDAVAVGNVDDPVVMAHLVRAPARHVTFGSTGDYHVDGGRLLTPGGPLASIGELWRALPHDVANALAAAATAMPGGAAEDGARRALLQFRGLPHRVTLVGESGGVRWYDDSKATAPHASLAALRSFDSVVLIAGGRNKGLDLGVLAEEAGRVRSVVAIGEAAGEVAAVFDGLRPVTTASSMAEAVDAAALQAVPGDVVLLSPGCASFDWYSSYAERGDDFARLVVSLTGAAP